MKGRENSSKGDGGVGMVAKERGSEKYRQKRAAREMAMMVRRGREMWERSVGKEACGNKV